MTLAEMCERMDSAEYSYWVSYFSIRPLPEIRADVRAGIIASTIANAFRGKHGRTAKVADFMPFANEGRGSGMTDKAQIAEHFRSLAASAVSPKSKQAK